MTTQQTDENTAPAAQDAYNRKLIAEMLEWYMDAPNKNRNHTREAIQQQAEAIDASAQQPVENADFNKEMEQWANAGPRQPVVDELSEAKFAEYVMTYMNRHDQLSITWGDMAALSQQENTSALPPTASEVSK